MCLVEVEVYAFIARKRKNVWIVEASASAIMASQRDCVCLVEAAEPAIMAGKGQCVWIVEASDSVPIKKGSLNAKIQHVLRKWQRQRELWLREGLAEFKKPNCFNASIKRI